MVAALAAVWFLNLFDAVASWYAVEVARYATEENPLMRWLMASGPWAFFGVKVGLVTAGVAILASMREERQQFKKLVFWLTALYSALALYHLCGFFWCLP